MVEAGSTLSLTVAEAFTSTEVCFPTHAAVASEKLMGWSVAIDVFHGVAHPLAVSVRSAVTEICPSLDRLAASMAENPAAGMDLVCRVMYDMQQDYFQWVTSRAAGQDPDVPTFAQVKSLVLSFRVHSLSPLPTSWYSLVEAPTTDRDKAKAPSSTPSAGSAREQAGVVPTFYTQADRTLLNRFHDSEHNTISQLLAGKGDDIIPQLNGKPVCLSWALKGQCSATCKRKEQHKPLSRAVNQKIHAMLDTCGVANPQP